MKTTILPEESAILERMERLLKLQNAATHLELLIRKTRDLEARQLSYDRNNRQRMPEAVLRSR